MAEARYSLILDQFALQVGLGIHPHEADPQRVLIDVQLDVVYPHAPRDDRIEEAMDYDFIRAGIHRLATERHFALQETLCEGIAALCLADARVERVTVRTRKPDIYADAAAVGCEIVRGRRRSYIRSP